MCKPWQDRTVRDSGIQGRGKSAQMSSRLEEVGTCLPHVDVFLMQITQTVATIAHRLLCPPTWEGTPTWEGMT